MVIEVESRMARKESLVPVVHARVHSVAALQLELDINITSNADISVEVTEDDEELAGLEQSVSGSEDDFGRSWPHRSNQPAKLFDESRSNHSDECICTAVHEMDSSRIALLLGRHAQPEGLRLILRIEDRDQPTAAELEIPTPKRKESAPKTSHLHDVLAYGSLWSLESDPKVGVVENAVWHLGLAVVWKDLTLQLASLEHDRSTESLSMTRIHQLPLTLTMNSLRRLPTDMDAGRNHPKPPNQRKTAREIQHEHGHELLKQRSMAMFVTGMEKTPYCAVLVAEGLQLETPNAQIPETRRRTRSMRHPETEQGPTESWQRILQIWDVQYGLRHWTAQVDLDEMAKRKISGMVLPALGEHYLPWTVYDRATARVRIAWSESGQSAETMLWLVSFRLPLPRSVQMAHSFVLQHEQASTRDREHFTTAPADTSEADTSLLEQNSSHQKVPERETLADRRGGASSARQCEEMLLAAIHTGSRTLWKKAGALNARGLDGTSLTMSQRLQGCFLDAIRSGQAGKDSVPDAMPSPTLRAKLIELNNFLQEYLVSCVSSGVSLYPPPSAGKLLSVRYEDLRAAFPEASSLVWFSEQIPWVPIGYHCVYIPVQEQLQLLLHHLHRLQALAKEASHRLASDLCVCSLYAQPRPTKPDTDAVLQHLPLRDVCCILADVSRRLNGMSTYPDSLTSSVLNGALTLCTNLLDLHWAELVISEAAVLVDFAKAISQKREGLESAQRLQGTLEQWLHTAQRV
jgi:hypothetical protein